MANLRVAVAQKGCCLREGLRTPGGRGDNVIFWKLQDIHRFAKKSTFYSSGGW